MKPDNYSTRKDIVDNYGLDALLGLLALVFLPVVIVLLPFWAIGYTLRRWIAGGNCAATILGNRL